MNPTKNQGGTNVLCKAYQITRKRHEIHMEIRLDSNIRK